MPEIQTVTRLVPGTMEGVTAAIVAFLFVCMIFPSMVRNRPQYYGAFSAVLCIILLHSLNMMIQSTGFEVFAGVMTGLLQIIAIILLFLSVGGLTVRELARDMAHAFEVIRRGEEEKTIIIPLTGQVPKPKDRDDEPPRQVYQINSPSDAPSPSEPDKNPGLPLE